MLIAGFMYMYVRRCIRWKSDSATCEMLLLRCRAGRRHRGLQWYVCFRHAASRSRRGAPLVAASSTVLYKDGDLVAINKPAGLAVHGGPGMREDLSAHLHLWQYERSEPPHLAHRLDKDTSGVLLLTRHTDAARKMAALFQEHRIIKKYLAIAVGVPARLEGSVKVPLGTKNVATSGHGRHRMHRVILRTDQNEFPKYEVGRTLASGVQLACTKYRVLHVSPGKQCCLLEVQPLTGFKHQVRVHLADGLWSPVLGDYKFGGPLFRLSSSLNTKMKNMKFVPGKVYLHASELELPDYHQKGKALVIRAPLPEHFCKTAKMLRLQVPPKYL